MSDERENLEEAPIVFIGGKPYRIGQRIMTKALERDMAILAAQQQAAENEQLRVELDRRERKELYDRVIEKYNRSHSHRKKTTLKEICEQMGVSYEAVKKYRLRTRKNKSR